MIIDITFGPDGNFYLISSNHSRGQGPNRLKRFNGKTGAFLGDFADGSWASNPTNLLFGPDGNLYVTYAIDWTVKFQKYNSRMGAFIGAFISRSAGELKSPVAMAFGPDNNLYIGNGEPAGAKSFDGKTGKALGEFIPSSTGELKSARYLVFRTSSQKPRSKEGKHCNRGRPPPETEIQTLALYKAKENGLWRF